MSRADIYGYVDEQGISHFSAEKLDSHYKLWSKSALGSVGLESATPSGTQSARFAQHPNLKKYEPLLKLASLEFSVELHLLKAVMAAESGFNPDAVSPKGAIGLMQVMPATAQRYGLAGDKKKSLEQKLRDPKTNIRLGARYLSELAKRFPGQRDLVIASYNAGEGAVRQYKNAIPPYAETRNYVQLVSELYRVYQPKLTGNKGRAMALRDVANGGKRIPLDHRRIGLPGLRTAFLAAFG
jgi:soluble lytic murein transglycosylase-like protein